jgi:hypothetical protein
MKSSSLQHITDLQHDSTLRALNKGFIYHITISPFVLANKIIQSCPTSIPTYQPYDQLFKSNLHCLHQLYTQNGLLSLWTGFIPFTISNMTWYIGTNYFPEYKSRRTFTEQSLTSDAPDADTEQNYNLHLFKIWLRKSLIISSLSLITYPFEVIATRMAVDLIESPTDR